MAGVDVHLEDALTVLRVAQQKVLAFHTEEEMTVDKDVTERIKSSLIETENMHLV